MSAIQICGGKSLCGEIRIQGSKNAVLPMMAASLLHRGVTVIENVPIIQDVSCMMGILEYIGCKCMMKEHTLRIDSTGEVSWEIPECRVRQMRSSVILLGALLGREGRAVTAYPGGCSIGSRPIDFHIQALKKLGAGILENGSRIEAYTKRLSGAEIWLPFPSVGATENALLGAVKAKGRTVIQGASMEPEILALCHFLKGMGAVITGEGTGRLIIDGVEELQDSHFTAPGDRIVAGTYLIAAMAAKGNIKVSGIVPKELSSVTALLEESGAEIGKGQDFISLSMDTRPKAVCAFTGPYPAFPTDLQSPFLALMSGAEGTSRIEENVFEGRYETAGELQKMGADIKIEGKTAFIKGRKSLYGAIVEAADLRGGAALVTAALGADGVTRIERCFHIERGYEDICRDLRAAGADIGWTDS
ncbi:UDP-N-acetylglucosamine 1-carboxyvinyltransferase [Lachnospiraceae bacterium 62-35]